MGGRHNIAPYFGGAHIKHQVESKLRNPTAQIEYPASFSKMWNDVRGLNGSPDITMQQMKIMLNDYTKNNSWLGRVASGHWNRQHVKEVKSQFNAN